MKRADRNKDNYFRGYKETVTRPKILDGVLPMYESNLNRYPGRVRISFEDGTTAVYNLDVKMPNPNLMNMNKIIHKWLGYKPGGKK